MKKLNIAVAAGFLAIAGLVYAGNQVNWGTSTGGSWNTPDDTKTTAGQILQIGASGGATVVAGGTSPMTLVALSSTAINALTPATTGQIVYCINCLSTQSVCISTGVLSTQWAVMAATTNVGGTFPLKCQ